MAYLKSPNVHTEHIQINRKPKLVKCSIHMFHVFGVGLQWCSCICNAWFFSFSCSDWHCNWPVAMPMMLMRLQCVGHFSLTVIGIATREKITYIINIYILYLYNIIYIYMYYIYIYIYINIYIVCVCVRKHLNHKQKNICTRMHFWSLGALCLFFCDGAPDGATSTKHSMKKVGR